MSHPEPNGWRSVVARPRSFEGLMRRLERLPPRCGLLLEHMDLGHLTADQEAALSAAAHWQYSIERLGWMVVPKRQNQPVPA